jgi:EAL and modified HD-GYP domain-containing signal transduction protein
MSLWNSLVKLFTISPESAPVLDKPETTRLTQAVADSTPARKSEVSPAIAALPFGASVTQRPLVDTQLQVAGFEFRLNEKIVARLHDTRNNPARISYYSALLTAARLNAQQGRISLVGLPADLLEREFITDRIDPGLWLIIYSSQEPSELACTALHRLREHRVLVGWQADCLEQFMNPHLPMDFVAFKHEKGNLPDLINCRQLWHKRYPKLIGIATDLSNIEQIETAVQGVFELATGAFVAAPCNQDFIRPLTPAAGRLCQILNAIMNGAAHAEIVEQLKLDLKISYQLLCHINSASVGLKYPVDSLNDALYLLGRNQFYQWLSMMLARSATARPASRALQEISLGRARFLEGLAQATGAASPELLFSLGIFSLLHLLLNTSVDQALQPLRLSPNLSAALYGVGPWAIYLQLVIAWEHNDGELVAKLTEQVGLTPEKVADLAAMSIIWARQAMDSAK